MSRSIKFPFSLRPPVLPITTVSSDNGPKKKERSSLQRSQGWMP
jgi:hypothetical protein